MLVILDGPKKNEEYIFYVSLMASADADTIQPNPTLAAGDVLVSTDGGATANIATIPVVTPAGGRNVKVTLAAAEMNGTNVVVTFEDQTAGEEWRALTVSIHTRTVDIEDLVRSTTPANTLDINATGGVGVGSIEDDVITSDSMAADAIIAAALKADCITSDKIDETTYAQIADDVWDEPHAAHTTPNTVGQQLVTDINAILVDTAAIEGRLTDARAALIENLDAAVSTRSAPATAQTINLTTAVDGAGADTVGKALENCIDYVDTLLSTLSTLTQAQVTGGAYALDTDASGRIRIVDGTAAGELDTTSGLVNLNLAQDISGEDTAQTVGGSLKLCEASERYKKTLSGGERIVYDADGVTALVTRTSTSTSLTPA